MLSDRIVRLSDGVILFGRAGDFTGEVFTVSDKVGRDVIASYNSTFSVSDNGVLVYDPSLNRQRRQYRWVDRRGQQKNSLDVVAGIFQLWLSPNEKRFIADRFDPRTITTTDLGLCDVSGGNPVRFTLDPANDFNPVWSPDGRHIVWASSRDGGVTNLHQIGGQPRRR